VTWQIVGWEWRCGLGAWASYGIVLGHRELAYESGQPEVEKHGIVDGQSKRVIKRVTAISHRIWPMTT
jgi:hypothetical protein